jgi:hypothetical protein
MIEALLAALLPIGVQAGKSLVNRFMTPKVWKPQSVDDYVKMQQADTDRLKAIGGLEGEGLTYKWVEAIRKLMRPAVVCCVLYVWAKVHLIGGGLPGLQHIDTSTVDNLTADVFFYLFGDRTALYYEKSKGGK